MLTDYKPAYIRWWEDDFWADRDVIAMTWLQRLLYRALLQAAFFCDTRPFLPDDDEKLWRLAGAKDLGTWRKNQEPILAKFTRFQDEAGMSLLRHKRLEEEWAHILGNSARASRAGEASARAKVARRAEAQGNGRSAVVNHSDTDPESEAESKSDPQKPTPPNPLKGELPFGFPEFWASYPKKNAKLAAVKAWNKLKPDADLQGKLLAAIDAWKQTDQWKRDGGKYIPYPASWLNGQRWLDEVEIHSQGDQINDRTGGILPPAGKYANKQRLVCEA